MFDFGGVVLMIVDAVRATVMSYYRLKYLIGRNVVTDILDNINYVDKCLESVGIQVAHTRNLIVCVLYTVVNILALIVLLYWSLVRTDMLKTFQLVKETISCYSIVVDSFSYYLMLLFLMHFVFLVYTIGGRMRLVHHAIAKF